MHEKQTKQNLQANTFLQQKGHMTPISNISFYGHNILSRHCVIKDYRIPVTVALRLVGVDIVFSILAILRALGQSVRL